MGNKLVSIVSPVYNGESYIARYLDSIISQTYAPLELILVNDGSTDSTDEIVSSYMPKILEKGISIEYIKQSNTGLGGAINNGIKHITGDYIIWPDTDDYLFPDAIEKRVAFLEKHPEYGLMYSDGKAFDEESGCYIGDIRQNSIPENGDIFNNILNGSIIFNPCGYMLRTSAFLDVNSHKEIFPSRYGQDIQMLLPIASKYKCGYLHDLTYVRVSRSNSLSQSTWLKDNMAWLNRTLGESDIYTETLKGISNEALAYIPFIKFRDLRIIVANTRKIGGETYKTYKKALRVSRRLMIKELIKSFWVR